MHKFSTLRAPRSGPYGQHMFHPRDLSRRENWKKNSDVGVKIPLKQNVKAIQQQQQQSHSHKNLGWKMKALRNIN